MTSPRNLFDLSIPAPNGLKRGLTTGTCATACVKAALLHLLEKEFRDEVTVDLPDSPHYVSVSIHHIEATENGVQASTIKDAGDDPDQTHRATIFAIVRRTDHPGVSFKAGKGVGTVTEPGVQIPVGEPAINPVPRRMMKETVEELLEQRGDSTREKGVELEIGCLNGETIAQKTFNPRIGILGGISILGTTGIVEPKSLASFKAAIEVYIRVAIAPPSRQIVIAPGNLGQRFARNHLKLPIKQVVQVSNFMGFGLDYVEELLSAEKRTLPCVSVIGHPGKLAKIIDHHWDTHSHKSPPATEPLLRLARAYFSTSQVPELETSLTVERMIGLIDPHPDAPDFWRSVEESITTQIRSRLKSVEQIQTLLFRLNGTQLSRTT